MFIIAVRHWRRARLRMFDKKDSTHGVVASYKPSMLVTRVRFPVCALVFVMHSAQMRRVQELQTACRNNQSRNMLVLDA